MAKKLASKISKSKEKLSNLDSSNIPSNPAQSIFPIVGIGSSAGGIEALKIFLALSQLIVENDL